MPQLSQTLLEPRKSPVQARSTASVDAILEATAQVLCGVGKERLTTAKVASRAGVSIGTLYQYFPNKTSLLRAILKRHMDEVTEAVELVCQEQRGASLSDMATGLVTTFLKAKMCDPKTSVALYSVSSDVDGAQIVQQLSIRSHQAIAAMLTTAREPLNKDPELIASILHSPMSGVSRRLLESVQPEKQFETFRLELTVLVCSYLAACCAA